MDTSAMDISACPQSCVQDDIPSNQRNIPSAKVVPSCQKQSLFVTPENKRIYAVRTSSMRKRVLYNPFNHNLKEQFEKPSFSPTVFSVVVSPSQDSDTFKWDIEDISAINPAKIEEEFAFEEQLDQETENEIQETIEKYFSVTHMVPSPWDRKFPTSWRSFSEVHKMESSSSTSDDAHNVTVESDKSHYFDGPPAVLQTSSTQTALSLPPDLPQEVNNALKPYFSESMDLSISSRKLFCAEEGLSPVRFISEEKPSPILGGYIVHKSRDMCYPSTPVVESRTIGTPLPKLTPIDISPISHDVSNKSASALQISLMQIDGSSYQEANREDSDHEESKMKQRKQQSESFGSPKFVRLCKGRKRRRTFGGRKSGRNVMMSPAYKMMENLDSVNKCSDTQDTGYNTDSRSGGYSYTKTPVSRSAFSSNTWNCENKENIAITSTPPTKRF